MPITSITSDPEHLTLTIVGDYPVPVERLWDAWADPRQIERFWGPPGWPATFTRHDMVAGGRTDYVMTGPDGERSAGYWFVTAIEPGRSFEFTDGFVGDDGEPNDEMPSMTMRYEFESTPGGSRFTGVTRFPSIAAMEQLTAMGMVEGVTAAFGQMDDLLADLAAFANDRATDATLLDELRFRTSRVVRGPIEQVWRAHHDAELVRRWMLGPDGWTMPVCEVAEHVGDAYRYEWESVADGERFGFEGELIESLPPVRAVTTERPIGSTDPGTVNELTLTSVAGGTLVCLVVTCPSVEVRDEMLATGMLAGMEFGYARLDEVLAAGVG
jgi:uncharacterized protein YndB with AHSA1/START domain